MCVLTPTIESARPAAWEATTSCEDAGRKSSGREGVSAQPLQRMREKEEGAHEDQGREEDGVGPLFVEGTEDEDDIDGERAAQDVLRA